MSDHFNHELLSAYLDNEVTGEERAQVEQALAESAEIRSSLESLRQLQSRLRAVPRRQLPSDFHQRVAGELERRAIERAGAVERSARPAAWPRVAALTALAAALVVALVIAINSPDSEVTENPRPVPGSNRLVGDPDIDKGPALPRDPASEGLTSPEGLLTGPDLPEENQIAGSHARHDPLLIMVYDLAITKQAQREQVFVNALKRTGITFDRREEGVVLDAEQRTELLSTRLAAGMDQPKAGREIEHFDVVEMVYIRATTAQLEDVWNQMVANAQVRAVVNAAVRPDSLQVLNSIGEQSWSLAQASGNTNSYAYRVNIGITLHSNRGSFLAKFPSPGLGVRILEKDQPSGSLGSVDIPLPFNPAGGNAAQLANPEANPDNGLTQIQEMLVILRNLEADFPAPDGADR